VNGVKLTGAKVIDLVFGRFNLKTKESKAEAVFAFHQSAYRIAYSILGNREQAEDIAQDAMLKAIRSEVEPSELGAWIRTITVRTALNAKRRPPTRELDESSPAKGGDITNDLAVRITMAKLSPDHRAVLALVIGERLSYGDVSAILGIPEGTVGSRLSAAKAAFRQEWET
jgi:RNA polymerase sigma-70 factor, ECF subfamily